MGREFELKYRANTAQMQKIAADWQPFETITMHTSYFDTPTASLAALRWTLRCRLENGTPICTLKTPAQGTARGEWETPCADIHDAIPRLVALGAPEALLAYRDAPLICTCSARFTRLCRTIAGEGSTIELALDTGTLQAGDNILPFSEVELEHKSGSEAATTAFSQAFSTQYALIPEPLSKFRRARDLRHG